MMDPTAEGLEQPGDRETATVSPLDQLPEHTGRRLGYSAWQRITQERINRFAAPTGDWQWIHVAPQRAARGPFGATVAHGFPTLAAPLPAGASTRQGVKRWTPSSAAAVCRSPSALPSRCTAKPNQSVSPRWCSATTPEHLDRRPRPPGARHPGEVGNEPTGRRTCGRPGSRGARP